MKMELGLWLLAVAHNFSCLLHWHSGASGAESSSAPRQSSTADGDAASDTDEDDVSDVDNESLRSDHADMLLFSEDEEQQTAVAGRRLWNASAIHPNTVKNWQVHASSLGPAVPRSHKLKRSRPWHAQFPFGAH